MNKVDKRKISWIMSVLLFIRTRRCGDGARRTGSWSLRHSPREPMECKGCPLPCFDTLSYFHRFRWVYCQLEALRHCLAPCVRRILAELPDTLDETYERVLREINRQIENMRVVSYNVSLSRFGPCALKSSQRS